MSRGIFRGNNSVTYETWSFETESPNSETFDPSLILSDSDRVTWLVGDGVLRAGNSLSYTFPDSTRKTVTIRTNSLDNLTNVQMYNDRIVGHLDFSPLKNLKVVSCGNSSVRQLTGVTHNPENSSNYTVYNLIRCNLLGDLDLTYLTGLGGSVDCSFNSNLTSVTHTASTRDFSNYNFRNCDITGTHDVSMLPNVAGYFQLQNNVNLTRVIHASASTRTSLFNYYVSNCDLTGHIDFTPLTGHLTSGYGQYQLYSNSNLTGITHTYSTKNMSGDAYIVHSCDITGSHDLRMLTGMGGRFRMHSNSNLTEILHTGSTQTFTDYLVYNCDLTGTHDVSQLTGLCDGALWVYNNPNMTNILLPVSNKNLTSVILRSNNLGYVDFNPLSGASMNCDIELQNNGMTAVEVNQILVDFDNLSTNVNPNGWTGCTLGIDGTNATPDTTSGGFNGIAAIDSLTGITNNWNITTS